MEDYKRIDLDDRRGIEDGLNKNLSFRTIATTIGRSASSVAKEIKNNRTLIRTKVARSIPCGKRQDCMKKGICQTCVNPKGICARCEAVFCPQVCEEHLELVGCKKTTSAPWVCNGCRKRRIGCNRPGRHEYSAVIADKLVRKRRSASRRGVNMTIEDFEAVLATIRPALARKLSPYEISVLYGDELGISVSTLYRWVERGYGGCANIDLERKVGFAPRKQHVERRITHHGRARSYASFLSLTQDEQDGCCEMDTVLGSKNDKSCILTLYLRPAQFQLYLLLEAKTSSAVKAAFDALEEVCGRKLFCALFSVILTDNGPEFEDPAAIERPTLPTSGKRCRVFYCDPRQSQQKGRCEKAHTELRQKLPKGRSLDGLSVWDIAEVCSHVNSTPRRSLCGMSPVEMMHKAYGEDVGPLLDHLGIEQMGADDIDLSPIDIHTDDNAPV